MEHIKKERFVELGKVVITTDSDEPEFMHVLLRSLVKE